MGPKKPIDFFSDLDQRSRSGGHQRLRMSWFTDAGLAEDLHPMGDYLLYLFH